MICSSCGKNTGNRIYPGKLCQSCYRYFKEGGTINEPPKPGTVEYDARGYVICHICGRSYKRLGSHIKESHNMTIAEYKENFGLCNNAKTTEKEYSEHMRNLSYKYMMPERLQQAGKNTRIKQGEKHLRSGKKSRLQECLNRSKQYKKEN